MKEGLLRAARRIAEDADTRAVLLTAQGASLSVGQDLKGTPPHEYFRHGTTSLFAAFNIADGTVISSIHRQRAVEFKKFLRSP